MTTYRISAPNGKTYQIEGPPGATREQVIQAVLAQAPEAGQAPETTFLGQVGEAFKGVIPGAIGLVEQAAIGASALLPQEQERAAREAIAGVAGAAKAPFAPAPGYEGTVGRKFGEAAGSFIPFLGLGPLGLAGRAGAVGLGVGAGAGEARTRAETEGATEEQRAAATALGTIPGALEVFAPFRILKRIPEGEVLTAVDRVKRVALAGGEEAAQEAASGLAQNMIARGVYKPDQALIEGLGEQAAYGGAVGGLAQGLLDLALGRRARGAGAGEPAPPEGQTAIDVAKAQREQAKAEQEAARAAPTNTAQATIDETLTQSISEAYPKLTQAIEALKQQPATKERNEAIKALEAERGRRQREDAEQRIGGKRAAEGFLSAEEAAAAGVSPREEFDPTQARREEIARLRQQREDTLVNGKPPALKSPARRRFDELDARLLEIGGGRWTPPTAPTTPTAEAEEPKVRKAGAPATGLQPADIDTLGITKKQPIYRRMLGKDMHDPAQRDVVLADIESYLTKDLGSEESRAKLTEFKERFAEPTVPTATVAPSVVAAPEPAPEVPTAAPPVAAAPEPETPSAVRTEPETSGAGAPVAGEPSAGAAPAGAGEAEPTGVVPPVEDAGQPVGGEGEQPAAVTPPTPAKLTPAERADLVEQIERVSGKISQDEYDAFYARHTDAKGERVKNRPESIKAAQDLLARYGGTETQAQQTRTGPIDLENSRQMDDALRGKSFEEAVDYAIKNARDDADRQILVKAKRRVEQLKAQGVEFNFHLTDKGRVLIGKYGITETTSAGLGEATSVKVVINGYTGDPGSTLNQEVLAHEIVHAVTSAQISFAPQGSAATKLRNLQQELVGIYNQRHKAGTLTSTEKGIVLNALENDKELLAYGLTNGDVQNWLASITDPSGGTFLSRLFGVVSQVLGLKGKENSALARLMSISEEILDESLTPYVAEANLRGLSFGKQANLTGIPSWVLKEAQGLKPVWNKGSTALYEGTSVAGKTIYVAAKKDVGRTHVDIRSYTGKAFTPAELADLRQAADGLTPQTDARAMVGEKEQPTLGEKLNAKFGGNKAIGFRAQAMDLLAGIDYIFTKAYGNRIRDNRGDYNPVFLMSRALDAPRFAKEVQEFGTMRRDPTGLLSVDTLVHNGQEISYKQVLESIAAEAKARSVNPETFLKDIGESLAAHREYELMNDPQVEKDIEFFLTPEEAKAAEDAFQADAFIKGVSEKLDAVRFALIDTMVDAGRITAEKAKEWKEATGYIPFSRIDEFDNLMQRPDAPSNVKLAAFKQIKEFKGSKERQTENPVTRFSNLMDWMVNESMKADAVGNALTEMELLGYAEFVPNPKTVDNNKRGALTPPVYVKGQPKTFYVPDPANLAAFVGAPTNNIPGFIKAAQKFSQFLRVGVTATPPFAIKQVLDDITRAYVHSGVKNPAAMLPRILLNFPRNWWNEIRGVQSAAVKELAKSGVVPAYDTIVGDNVRDILQETGLAPRSVGKAIMRVMEAGAKASDVSVREAIFNQTMKETGDKALAELRAREIINFSRRGTARTTDYLIRTIPFFNAYARSMDKLLLAAAGSPSAQRTIGATTGYARNLFYKRMGVLTAMGFAYALLMSDDEEYQNLPDHVRDRNWIIPGGKELGFVPAMPIPAELSFFFKAIPERVVQYYKLQGTPEERDGMRVLKELMLSGVDIFSSPNITPQVLKPILENLVNYSFFLGRPLESQAQLALDPSERYGTGTSEALKEVSKTMTDIATSTGIEALKVSPIMLENLVRGMFGMSAGIALSIADVMVNPTRTDRPLHQTLTAQLTGASAVMKDPVGIRFLDEIYNLDRSTEQVYNTYNRKLKSDPDDAEKYLKSNFGLYVARSEVRSTMEAIRELNAQARAIDKMKDLTPEERRLLINDLRTQQNDLARAVYRLRRQVAEEQRVMDASQ
jgi:hypothetical protein